MTITHIFFDLNGTLVDGKQMPPCYAAGLGRVMSERYGGQPGAWAEANMRILDDWDSYFADLDMDGENGIDDMWEGELRVTRALFRLTNTPEPAISAIAELARELPYHATRDCDVMYADSKPVIWKLHEAGYTLGVATHAITSQARGTLTGGGVIEAFTGPFLCPDYTERFSKDRDFFLAARIPPENCLVVDDTPEWVHGAKDAGMRAVLLCRDKPAPSDSRADHILSPDLSGLLAYLGVG